jgi:hypothetical protein
MSMVTMIKELDCPTVHFGYGYLFKVRLATEQCGNRWCSIIVHHLADMDWKVVKKALVGELKKKGIKWDTMNYENNQCYSKYEFAGELERSIDEIEV